EWGNSALPACPPRASAAASRLSSMRILVTVKFTPDLQSNRTFTDGRVTRTADDGSMNELDEHAVEAALQLVEAAGEGEVYALTVGGLGRTRWNASCRGGLRAHGRWARCGCGWLDGGGGLGLTETLSALDGADKRGD